MIEIQQRNGIWEAYVDGSLFHWCADLEDMLLYLARNVENIKMNFLIKPFVDEKTGISEIARQHNEIDHGTLQKHEFNTLKVK